MKALNGYLLCKPFEKDSSSAMLYATSIKDYIRGDVYKLIVEDSSVSDFTKGDIIYAPSNACLKLAENDNEFKFIIKSDYVLVKEEN